MLVCLCVIEIIDKKLQYSEQCQRNLFLGNFNVILRFRVSPEAKRRLRVREDKFFLGS